MKQSLLLTLAISALCLAPQAFSQEILDLIPLDSRPAAHSSVNPVTRTLYIPLDFSNQLAVLDISTGSVTYVPLEFSPNAVAVNPKTNLVYVQASGGDNGDAIYVIDGASNAVIDTISVTGSFGNAIAVNPVTNLIYFNSGPQLAIGVLDGATNQITATIQTVNQNAPADSIVVNPATNKVYLATTLNQSQPTVIAVIDGNTETFSGLITVPTNWSGADLDVDWKFDRLYVSCGLDLFVLNGRTQQWIETINVYFAGPIAVNQTTHEIAEFSVGQPPNILYFFNGSTYEIVGQVAFSTFELPYGLVADSSTNTYYVPISDNGKNGAVGIISGP
jgi:DNA-binding beta-propeller fold protein YncE